MVLLYVCKENYINVPMVHGLISINHLKSIKKEYFQDHQKNLKFGNLVILKRPNQYNTNQVKKNTWNPTSITIVTYLQ